MPLKKERNKQVSVNAVIFWTEPHYCPIHWEVKRLFLKWLNFFVLVGPIHILWFPLKKIVVAAGSNQFWVTLRAIFFLSYISMLFEILLIAILHLFDFMQLHENKFFLHNGNWNILLDGSLHFLVNSKISRKCNTAGVYRVPTTANNS